MLLFFMFNSRFHLFNSYIINMINFLQGKKTYLVAFGIALVTFLYQIQYIDESTYKMLLGWLNAFGAATLAAKMNRVDYKLDN